MNDETPVAKAEEQTDEDKFWLDWGRESLKANLQLSNDILRQIVTLSSVLLGSGVIFITKDVLPVSWVIPIMVIFLAALIISFLGVLPYRGSVDLKNVQAIQTHKNRALKSKVIKIWISGGFFLLGLLLAIFGLVYKALKDNG